MSRPVIGITCGVVETSRPRSPLHHAQTVNYVDAVVLAGGAPLLLPVVDQEDVLSALLPHLSGLLLAGGEDVDPSRYGEEPHPTTSFDLVRDEMETFLLRAAMERDLPILAICRGMQVANVALGGDLWQDIPSMLPHSHSHAAGPGNRAHTLDIVEGGALEAIIGPGPITANAFHHQAVRRLAPGLSPEAHTSDGILEGFSGPGPFFLATQCHPEALTDMERWLRLFSAFVAAS